MNPTYHRIATVIDAGWQGLRERVRPRSFMALLLLGFLMVALPLSGAFIVSSVQVDQLARQSQQALFSAMQFAQVARLMVEQAGSMDRTARQYVARRDASRFEAYLELRQDLRTTIDRQLSSLAADDEFSEQLRSMRRIENDIHILLRNAPAGSQEVKAGLAQFTLLRSIATDTLTRANGLVDHEVTRMRAMGENSQRILFWYAVALIPVAIVLAIVFFVLIAHPVHQLDEAIRQLGDGDFSRPLRIRGPKDLEKVGRRLDWLRTRLQELEEQKSRFLRHVSHELKTPLTVVREASELLAEGVVGTLNEKQAAAARIAHQNALRLQKLIEDLLSFSRLPEIGAQTMSHEWVRLDELVRHVTADYELPIRRKRLRLVLELLPLTIEGDRLKLRTVTDNLMSNAVKYAPDDGRIALVLSRHDGEAWLDVSDTGVGIEEEDQERIFEAFYQAKRQPPGPVRGTGLGLSIARECARLHGGDVTLLTPSRGGAHFRLVLPWRDTETGVSLLEAGVTGVARSSGAPP